MPLLEVPLQIVRRFRLQALFCALAVLVCGLISRPFAEMGISDDGPYILMAQHLATTGHIAYNGWASPMMVWQLYLGAAFIKLFGFFFTAVRMSTLLVAVVTAWLLQRTLVLAGVNERNATLGTLALVLSPLYLMLSVTYMSDIFGLLAVVTCLYGCLRALGAVTDRATIFWLSFAVATNAVFGTARQIAWLGILVMVPSALLVIGWRGRPGSSELLGWREALRERRRVLVAGSSAALVGVVFILACVQWFERQPHILHEHLAIHRGGGLNILDGLFHGSLELPFLLLPMVVLFLPELRRDIRYSVKVAFWVSAAWVAIALILHATHQAIRPVLEPPLGDWVTRYDGYTQTLNAGEPPVLLNTAVSLVLTLASLGGLIGLIVSLFRPGEVSSGDGDHQPITWPQICVLLAPFIVVYALILIPRASTVTGVFDRYLLEPLAVTLLWVVRLYQERIRTRMPPAAPFLVAALAALGVVMVHNMFSFYRARVELAAEIHAKGVPDASVHNGWEYDFITEIHHAGYISVPPEGAQAYSYVSTPPPSASARPTYRYDFTPHVHPIYWTSFDPNLCYGPAPFAPVHYSRWPYRTPGTLYVVRYVPRAKLPPGMP